MLLVGYACVYGGAWLLGLHAPRHAGGWTIASLIVLFTVAFAVGTVAHELGHAVAARLAGVRVLAITVGGRLGRVTVNVGNVAVSVGLGLGGSVEYDGGLSAFGRAAILTAGPAANVLIAPLCLLLPVRHAEAMLIMLGVVGSGLQDLVPARDETDGHLSDGAKLGQIPARRRADAEVRRLLGDPDWPDRPEAFGILVNGYRLDVPEAEDCLRELGKTPDCLLRVYRQPWTLRDQPEPDTLHIVDVLSSKVLLTGDLPAEIADLAAIRAEWVVAHLDKDHEDGRLPVWSARQTLALARLRQGRPADVRQLCAGALTAKIDSDDRATTLAIVAMARQALLLNGGPQLDEALALDPSAALVREAADRLAGDVRSVPVPAWSG
jgi:hypothetical protein